MRATPAPCRSAGRGTLRVVSERPHVLPNLPRAPRPQTRGAAPWEPVCALFRRYLHGESLKFTPERAMILDAALRREGLFEPDALLADVKQRGGRVSRATVYRTLAHLQDAGILKQVFFDNKQSYYEVIVGRQTHDYLICVDSGRVLEFSSDRLRQVLQEICQEHDYEFLSQQVQIFGLSPQARKAGRSGVSRARRTSPA